MADVTLSYKGSDILELSDSGSATLKTGGKYCEDDIAVEYVKPSGGEVWSTNVSSLQITNLVPTYLKVNVPNATVSLYDFLRGTSVSESTTVEVVCKDFAESSVTYRAFSNTRNIDTVIITASDTKYIQAGIEMSRQVSGNGVKRHLGLPFYTTGNAGNNYSAFSNNTRLAEFYVVPNKITSAFYLSSCANLVDATITSIANGLNASSVNTLTLHATPKAKLSAIVGNVTQKTHNDITDEEETFDFFTADENGTVTLMDFITNTKGWTVA